MTNHRRTSNKLKWLIASSPSLILMLFMVETNVYFGLETMLPRWLHGHEAFLAALLHVCHRTETGVIMKLTSWCDSGGMVTHRSSREKHVIPDEKYIILAIIELIKCFQVASRTNVHLVDSSCGCGRIRSAYSRSEAITAILLDIEMKRNPYPQKTRRGERRERESGWRGRDREREREGGGGQSGSSSLPCLRTNEL